METSILKRCSMGHLKLSSTVVLEMLFTNWLLDTAQIWKQSTPPTLSEWYANISDLCMLNKRINSIFSGDSDPYNPKFLKTWLPLLYFFFKTAAILINSHHIGGYLLIFCMLFSRSVIYFIYHCYD